MQAEAFEYLQVEILMHIQSNFHIVSRPVNLNTLIYPTMKMEYSFIREDNIFIKSTLLLSDSTNQSENETFFSILVFQYNTAMKSRRMKV